MPAAGMKSADLKQSSRDKASASHCVTMPALTPNAWDGERLEVRSLGRQCFGFGWRKSRAWAFWACRSPKARNHPPPPPQPRTPKIFRKWLKLHARVRAALQLHVLQHLCTHRLPLAARISLHWSQWLKPRHSCRHGTLQRSILFNEASRFCKHSSSSSRS